MPITGKDGWFGGHGLRLTLAVLQGGIAVSLLIVAAVVLVRTVVSFLDNPNGYPVSLITALDGILVVIILVDILHTVLAHLRDKRFPVRPFLVIGILAAIRDILSASARLELGAHQNSQTFPQSIIQLSIGVGVVIALLFGLLMIHWAGPAAEAEISS